MEQSPYTWIIAAVVIIGKLLLDRLSAGASSDDSQEPSGRKPPISPVDPFPNNMPRDRAKPLETEEEARMRRFREALGLPPETDLPPPRKVVPRPADEEEAPVFAPAQAPVPQPVLTPSAPQPAPIFREFPRPTEPPPWGEAARRASLPQKSPASVPPLPPKHDESLIPEFEDGEDLVNVPPAQSIEQAAPQMELNEELSNASSEAHGDRAPRRAEHSPRNALDVDLGDIAALKRAFILKEVLGAPKALQ
jgi:hypothetical protein